MLKTGEASEGFIIDHGFERIGKRKMFVDGRQIPDYLKNNEMVFMQFQDITESDSANTAKGN